MTSPFLKFVLVALGVAGALVGCGGGSADAAAVAPAAAIRNQTDNQRVTASGLIAPVDAGAQMDAAVAVGVGTTVNSP